MDKKGLIKRAFDDVMARPNFDAYQIFKMIVLGLILPIRIMFYFLIIFTHLFICWVASIGIPMESLKSYEYANKRLPDSWRDKLVHISSKYGSKLLCFTTGIRITVKGSENLKNISSQLPRPILVANHCSHLDPIVLMADIAPSFCAVGNTTHSQRPKALSRAVLVTHGILLSQNGPAQSTKIISSRVNSMDPMLPHLVIFPEGTTTNGTCLIKFNKGAFVHQRSVMPVILRYPYQYHNPSTPRDMGAAKLPHLIFMFLQFTTNVIIEYLPLYDPTPEEKSNPQLYANNVQKLIAKELNVPCYDVYYQDKYDYYFGNKNKKD